MPQGSHNRTHIESNASERQAFRRPHTSLGATGHWLREAGILAPLVISEFVKDGEKRWRYIRIASLATALLSEGMWTAKVHKEREAAHQREAMCHSPG
jgi:hypothetical protein